MEQVQVAHAPQAQERVQRITNQRQDKAGVKTKGRYASDKRANYASLSADPTGTSSLQLRVSTTSPHGSVVISASGAVSAGNAGCRRRASVAAKAISSSSPGSVS